MRRFLESVSIIFKPRKTNFTVRYMFPFLVGFGAVLGAAAITSDDVSYIRLEASNGTIEAGKQFHLDVYAFAHVPVNAVDITLRFDPDAVDVLGVDKGQSVLTIWTEEPIVESDKVILRGGTFRNGFLNEHKIASVNLRGKRSGISNFMASDVVMLAGDGAGTYVTVADDTDESQVSLYIYDEDADPGEIEVNVKIEIATDINGDGKVTLSDVSSFMAAWNSGKMVYDFNNDGRMTFKDFSIILADFFFK